VSVYLFEDDQLWTCEDESHDPGDEYHAPATGLRRSWETAEGTTDGEIAIQAHRRQ